MFPVLDAFLDLLVTFLSLTCENETWWLLVLPPCELSNISPSLHPSFNMRLFSPSSFALPLQRAGVLLPGGQHIRRCSSTGQQRQPRCVWEPCDGGSGPGEGAMQGRHVDVQRIREEQIHVRRVCTWTVALLLICTTWMMGRRSTRYSYFNTLKRFCLHRFCLQLQHRPSLPLEIYFTSTTHLFDFFFLSEKKNETHMSSIWTQLCQCFLSYLCVLIASNIMRPLNHVLFSQTCLNTFYLLFSINFIFNCSCFKKVYLTICAFRTFHI